MNQESPIFHAANASGNTRVLSTELHELLLASKIPEVQSLAPQAENLRIKSKEAALTIAFVGQYNAGKSTIIKALTRNANIVIDADVCTSEVTAYAWNDLLLLDTPGVQAGQADHDLQTERAILDANLVVFVITAELFSNSSAGYFRRLMLDGGKAKQSLLVVNKMSLDDGTEEAKRPYIDAVCAPHNSSDFSTVYMDAKCYLDSLSCADKVDQRELREASGFDAFIGTLNRFARERCDLGKITQPLLKLRSVAQQAAAITGTDQPTERAAIELLGRLEACVSESRAQLSGRMKSALGRAVNQIESAGDELADAIRDGAEGDLNGVQNASCQKIETARAALTEEAKQIIEEETDGLQERLSSIARSSLGKRVIDDINRGAIKVKVNFSANFGQSAPLPNNLPEPPVIDAVDLKKGVDLAKQIGALLGNWAAGPKAAGGGFFKAAEAAGGQAHHFVYDAGKFFGKNFKPWEAVKYAKWIGNIGKALGAAAAVLPVVLEVHEELQDQKKQLKLAGHRNDVRFQFREIARSLELEFWSHFRSFEKAQYENELEALRGMRNQLFGDQAGRSEESRNFVNFAQRADDLLRSLT